MLLDKKGQAALWSFLCTVTQRFQNNNHHQQIETTTHNNNSKNNNNKNNAQHTQTKSKQHNKKHWLKTQKRATEIQELKVTEKQRKTKKAAQKYTAQTAQQKNNIKTTRWRSTSIIPTDPPDTHTKLDTCLFPSLHYREGVC